MDVHPVWAQVPGSLVPAGGVSAVLPLLSQPSFVASQPFDAYLLSLTDPDSLAQTALTRATAAVASGQAAGAGAAHSTRLAPAQAQPGPPAAGPAPGWTPEPATAAAALPIVQTPEPAGPSLVEAEPAALAAPAPAGADNAVPAADLAAAAAAPALTGASPADTLAAGLPGLAIDATAKFMGAGAMGQPARVLSAYQSIQDAIPAVNRVLAASAMAANTSSHSGGRAFGQTAAQPGSKVTSPKASEPFGLDLKA